MRSQPQLERRLFFAAAVAAALCGPSCDPAEETQRAPVIVVEGEVSYSVVWETDGVAIADDGSWKVVTNLGTHVRVTRGYVTTYAVQLVECEEDNATAAASWGRSDLFGTGVAWAGHDDVANDIAFLQATVESMTPPVDRTLGVVETTGLSYCQGHYLVGRAPDDAVGLPEDVDMLQVSLHLEGTWRASDDENALEIPFTIRTRLANGALRDLLAAEGDAALRVDTAMSGAAVTVHRPLAGLFDNVDFASMDEEDTAKQLLLSMMDGVWVEVL